MWHTEQYSTPAFIGILFSIVLDFAFCSNFTFSLSITFDYFLSCKWSIVLSKYGALPPISPNTLFNCGLFIDEVIIIYIIPFYYNSQRLIPTVFFATQQTKPTITSLSFYLAVFSLPAFRANIFVIRRFPGATSLCRCPTQTSETLRKLQEYVPFPLSALRLTAFHSFYPFIS